MTVSGLGRGLPAHKIPTCLIPLGSFGNRHNVAHTTRVVRALFDLEGQGYPIAGAHGFEWDVGRHRFRTQLLPEMNWLEAIDQGNVSVWTGFLARSLEESWEHLLSEGLAPEPKVAWEFSLPTPAVRPLYELGNPLPVAMQKVHTGHAPFPTSLVNLLSFALVSPQARRTIEELATAHYAAHRAVGHKATSVEIGHLTTLRWCFFPRTSGYSTLNFDVPTLYDLRMLGVEPQGWGHGRLYVAYRAPTFLHEDPLL